jgi:hypothetical protein
MDRDRNDKGSTRMDSDSASDTHRKDIGTRRRTETERETEMSERY